MPYFVTIKKTRGVQYLYVMYSTYIKRPDGTKQKVQRVIRSFGRLEPLLAKDPEFVEKLRQQYPSKRQLKQQKQERQSANRKRTNGKKDNQAGTNLAKEAETKQPEKKEETLEP